MDDSGSDSDEMRCEETFLAALAYERFIRNASILSSSEQTSQGYSATDRRRKSNSNHIKRSEFHRDWKMMLDCPKASSTNGLEEETYNKSICIAFCLHLKKTSPTTPLLPVRPRLEVRC